MASLLGLHGALFEDFERLRREMDSLLSSSFGPASIRAAAEDGFPALNIGIAPTTVDVYLLAPGLDPKSLDITLEDRVLTVSGERPQVQHEGREYLRERFSGSFRRTITLTDDVDPDRVDAHYQNGVLHLSMGRKGEVQPRRIEIKQGDGQ